MKGKNLLDLLLVIIGATTVCTIDRFPQQMGIDTSNLKYYQEKRNYSYGKSYVTKLIGLSTAVSGAYLIGKYGKEDE